MPDAGDQSVPPVPPVPSHPATPSGRAPRQVRSAGLVLTIRAAAGVDRIDVAGELSVETVALLDAETVEVCRSTTDSELDLVLDLTGVTFLDVAGVAGLRRAYCRAVLLGAVRLGLPIASGPSRLMDLAVGQGWLPPAFRPGVPVV